MDYEFGDGYEHGVCMRPSQKTTIPKEIDRFIDIEKDVREEAIRIYQPFMKKTFRGNGKKRLLFYCLHQAYNNLHLAFSTDELVKLTGIEKSDINRALKLSDMNRCLTFSSLQDRSQDSIIIESPLPYVNELCNKLGFGEICNDVIDMGSKLLETDPSLLEEKPKNVAVGMIKLFVEKTGSNKSVKHVSEAVKVSDVTIKSLLLRLRNVYDKMDS